MFIRKLPKTQITKLDIGCRTAKKQGFTGLDIKDYDQEIVWNVKEGIPLADNSIEEIYCSHFIEHLEDKDLLDFFIELYRICKHGAIIQFIMPHSDSHEAYYLTHLSKWNENKFKGIFRGLRAGCQFVIIEMKRVGIELHTKVKVSKEQR